MKEKLRNKLVAAISSIWLTAATTVFLSAVAGILGAQDLHVEVTVVDATHPLNLWDQTLDIPMWVLDGNQLNPRDFSVEIKILPIKTADAFVEIELLDINGDPVQLVSPHTDEPVENVWSFIMDQNPDFFEENWRRRCPEIRAGEVFGLRITVSAGDMLVTEDCRESGDCLFRLERRGQGSGEPGP